MINKMNEKVAIMLGKNEGDESLDDDSSDADNVERLATRSCSSYHYSHVFNTGIM